jgi:thiol-disulfide isomerase/thioredoxin
MLLKPKLLSFCESNNITVVVKDVSDDAIMAEAIDNNVSLIPVVVINIDGKEVRRLVGEVFSVVKSNLEFAMKKLGETVV